MVAAIISSWAAPMISQRIQARGVPTYWIRASRVAMMTIQGPIEEIAALRMVILI